MKDQTTDLIGKLLPVGTQRDAVHFAVAPLEAAVRVKPGQHVGTDGNGKIAVNEPHIGIVDPFLGAYVKPGERCFVILYPNTITSLRHEWTHPAFSSKTASELWMRTWAVEHMGCDYYGDGVGDRLSEDAAFALAIRAGHELHVGPYESARDHINAEWWGHWEAITGQRGNRDEYFSCSC